mmetsp:Transcript_72/g.613  ORF Transcript_72/g.613 Transcript_72/m.613 type:complete len:93 (-) Transcript_72:509-787(-)
MRVRRNPDLHDANNERERTRKETCMVEDRTLAEALMGTDEDDRVENQERVAVRKRRLTRRDSFTRDNDSWTGCPQATSESSRSWTIDVQERS